MTAPEPSPLPWRDNGFGIVDSNGKAVKIYGTGTVDRKERTNRRLAIRGANSHDSLLAAAKQALDSLQQAAGAFPMDIEFLEGARITLHAAIAAAEEQAP